jgi:hypothetical protein
MILQINQNDTVTDVDVGDISTMSSDERTEHIHTKMTEAGLDPNSPYVILGEA